MIIPEKWIEESKEDLKFDRENFENNFGIAMKIAKWLERREKVVSEMIELMKRKKEVERKLFEYYKTEYDLVVNTKEEIKLLIQSDSEFMKIDEEVMKCEQKLKFIDKILDALKLKSWEVKYYLEWKKYFEGV